MPRSPKASTSRSTKSVRKSPVVAVRKKKNVAFPDPVVVPETPFVLQCDIPGEMTEFPQFMFSVYPNFNYVHDLVDLIHAKGGWVKLYDEKEEYKDPKRLNCTIKLVNFKEIILNYDHHKLGLLPNDAFDFDYVRHYLANPGPQIKLEKYRLTGSDYDIKRGKSAADDLDKFDGDDVVWKRKNWNDLPRLRRPDARVTTTKIMDLYQACGKHKYAATSSDEDEEVENIGGAAGAEVVNTAAEIGHHDEVDGSSPPRRKNPVSTATNDSDIDVEEESDDSSENSSSPKSSPPKRGKKNVVSTAADESDESENSSPTRRAISFITESYQPPLDKRNRVIRTARARVDPPAAGEWVDLDNQAPPPPVVRSPAKSSPSIPPQVRGKRSDKTKRVPVASPSRALSQSGIVPSASRSPPAQSSPPPTVQVRGKRKDKTKRVPVSSPPRDPSPDDIRMSTPSPTPTVEAPRRKQRDDDGSGTKKVSRKKSSDIPVPTASTSRAHPPRRRQESSRQGSSTRRASINSDINLEPSDDEGSSDYELDEHPAPRPRAVVKQHARTVGSSYAPRDLQAILDLILANKEWGRYVKGYDLWKFVERHKLLQHMIGYRTYQALHSTFRDKIHPVLMGESNKTRFRITDQQLATFKADRAKAAENPHSNFFPKNTKIQNVKRI